MRMYEIYEHPSKNEAGFSIEKHSDAERAAQTTMSRHTNGRQHRQSWVLPSLVLVATGLGIVVYTFANRRQLGTGRLFGSFDP